MFDIMVTTRDLFSDIVVWIVKRENCEVLNLQIAVVNKIFKCIGGCSVFIYI